MDTLFNVLSVVGSFSGIVAMGLFALFKNSAQIYIDEKARNLATIEDTERINDKIEDIKSKYELNTHAKKQIFEKEYDLLLLVWRSTWQFQAMARSLRPLFDYLPQDKEEQNKLLQERYNIYIESVEAFRDVVIKNKPFMPQDIYEICLSLRQNVISLQVDFESCYRIDGQPNWDKIKECGDKLDQKLEELSNAIRKSIYG